jgi:GAF domain-containing protein
MEATSGVPDGVAPERVPEGTDARREPLRYLAEATARLHVAARSDGLAGIAAAAGDIVRDLLGTTHGFVLVPREEQDLHLLFESRRLDPRSGARPSILEKALSSPHPVVEGQGSERRVALALRCGDRVLGGLYVASGEAEKRYQGHHLEIIQLLGAHLAAAVGTALQLQDWPVVAGRLADPRSASMTLAEARTAFEREFLARRLREAGGIVTLAARSLQLDRSQLSRVLRRYGIDRKAYLRRPD